MARWGDGAAGAARDAGRIERESLNLSLSLVLRGTRGGRTLVELNFWPVSSRVASPGWTGDGAQLLRNGLKYSRCMPCAAGTYAAAGAGGGWGAGDLVTAMTLRWWGGRGGVYVRLCHHITSDPVVDSCVCAPVHVRMRTCII